MCSTKIPWLSILIPVIVLLGFSPCHATPRVLVDKTTFDAGKVPEGTEVTHEFQFRNTGDQVLVIKPRAC